MKIKLNNTQKNAVKHWLKMEFRPKLVTCPFSKLRGNDYLSQKNKYCRICLSWFPKILSPEYNFIVFHPCEVYSLKYVIKRAREMVK